MLEFLRYLRDNACKIYIVTDGGQGFVRVFDDAFGPEVGPNERKSHIRICAGDAR
jgi:hypothetical protein